MNMTNLLSNYYFWLIGTAVSLIIVELTSRRKKDKIWAYETQDFVWFFFNAVAFGYILHWFFTYVSPQEFNSISHLLAAKMSFLSLGQLPLWLQVILLLLIQDFIEWLVHFNLHRVNFLWKIHKLHHSIEHMNWIGNFRFHWLEIVVYKSVKYIPLLIIAPSFQAAFIVGMIGVVIGSLNHLSLPFHWPTPLRYLLNSPGFHLWHHKAEVSSVNFAIIFSFWDFIFRTAHLDVHAQPAKIGLPDQPEYPTGFWDRFFMLKKEDSE